MIPLFKVFVPPEEVLMPRLKQVLYSGTIAHGAEVEMLEQKMSTLVGSDGVAVNSCTSALHMALLLAGVNQDDEVISSPMTAEPTNTSILYSGAKIVWADIEANSGNIDPDDIRKKITNKTKAIVVVHYTGIPARMNDIMKIANEYGLVVIEDAAQAIMAKYDKGFIGHCRGDNNFVTFSFQAIKHMTTGDGGILFCPSNKTHKAKRMRWFGMDRQTNRFDDNIDTLGFKYNMNEITASIGNIQLDFLEKNIAIHKSNGIFYDTVFDAAGIKRVAFEAIAEPTYWVYSILVENRDRLIKKLAENGIQSSVVHKRNDIHSIFSGSKSHLPNLDYYYSHILHIPCGWWVSEQDRNEIANIIISGW